MNQEQVHQWAEQCHHRYSEHHVDLMAFAHLARADLEANLQLQGAVLQKAVKEIVEYQAAADKLAAENKELREDTSLQEYKDAIKSVRSLNSEVESLRADAARYRWLRHGDNDEKVLCNGPIDTTYWYLLRNEKLDAAIDAAMKRGEA